MAEKELPISDTPCPFETDTISCLDCGGRVNVSPAGEGMTEVHCDECGSHYGIQHEET